MNDQLWSWILTAVGLTGFILAGRKVWWCWYINIACQALWFAYALATEQYGFIVAALAYTFVFTKNAIKWTKEHLEERPVQVDVEEWTKSLSNQVFNPNEVRKSALVPETSGGELREPYYHFNHIAYLSDDVPVCWAPERLGSDFVYTQQSERPRCRQCGPFLTQHNQSSGD